VKLLGKLDHQELVKALEWAQVVLLPSQFESFGLAVAEAQTAALPVIAYHSAAVTEMIEDGKTGWLVPLNRT
ncbi:glycosyltransferase, partial [Candidatus Saccharibacteria bacterium]|nr:glycosyltransferase [Candidatus Saccharibacteria bacterium]NIR48959.1 glycosyltransferase [candidate division KSB1 bacterium]NIV03676.1 glycosyltransferase [Calditrichia bacterium]NIV71977.1 glycosyltransferase [Calditrichia bacterium]NIV98764.1 glycosyltransferase [Candidatus Saccharibacteria bacterium]